MKLSDKPVPNPVVVLREEFDDWAVLFNPDTAEAVGINPVGVAMWKVMDGKHTLEDIMAEVRDRFTDVPESSLDELTNFINNLAESGFVGYELKDFGK
jgi:SynChlorMet cassette protein ScmD